MATPFPNPLKSFPPRIPYFNSNLLNGNSSTRVSSNSVPVLKPRSESPLVLAFVSSSAAISAFDSEVFSKLASIPPFAPSLPPPISENESTVNPNVWFVVGKNNRVLNKSVASSSINRFIPIPAPTSNTNSKFVPLLKVLVESLDIPMPAAKSIQVASFKNPLPSGPLKNTALPAVMKSYNKPTAPVKKFSVSSSAAMKSYKDATASVNTDKIVHITPAMAHELIQVLRSENVDFIVAPYEADAQLAYLSTLSSEQGGIDAVITEDSDLIAYGCPAIIFKMDRYGNSEEFLMDKVFNNVSNELSFKNFNEELFTGMCVLAGCDFLPSIPGIGTKRAHTLVSKYRNLDRVLSVLKLDKKYQVPEDYSDTFKKSLAVFHHARIYDPETKSLKMLKPLDEKHAQYLNGDFDLLGPDLPPSIAIAIAEGHLNPITMEAFNQFSTSDYISTSSNESQTISTQDSCITVFPEESNKKITIIMEEISMDTEKYKKEALALGKLITRKTQKIQKQEASKMEVPNNNPFKKRKVEPTTSKDEKISDSTMNVEQTVDIMCLSSSPDSQVSIESKPLMRLSSEEKNQRIFLFKNEKSGLLKFFERS